MPTPLYLVTGLHAESMAAATLGLQFDLPDPVVVRHEVDVAAGTLRRTVSDITGVLEREVVRLEHACASCAVREDVIPTLERLGQLDRWQAIVVHLPVAADGSSVCRVLEADRRVAPSVRAAAVVLALDGPGVVGDLLGDDLLSERFPVATAGDHRGVGEVLAAMVEYADLVAVFGDVGPDGTDLLRHLARPGVRLGLGGPDLPAGALLAGLHDHRASERWVAEVYQGRWREAQGPSAWRMELTTTLPLHPERFREGVPALGSGRLRTRGCFWVASRPGQVGVWDGAGGQVSIGTRGSWGRARPLTRLLFTGLLEDDVRPRLREAFDGVLLTDDELRARGPRWEVARDGLEPWLGAIRRAA